MENMTREQMLQALLGALPTPEQEEFFRTATPAQINTLSGQYYVPYRERLDLGEAPDVNGAGRSPKNYLQQVLRALNMGQ